MLEYLKTKADFDVLPDRFKKPFRAHINKHQGLQGAQHSFNDSGSDPTAYSDYFVSDGFHSVKCSFSQACREEFERAYPSSVKIHTIVNMLICVQSYKLELRFPTKIAGGDVSAVDMFKGNTVAADLRALKSLDVVLVIDELRVISFDRFGMKMPSSVAFDDTVRVHLGFLR